MDVQKIERVIRDQMRLPVTPDLLTPIEAHQARAAEIRAEQWQPDKEARELALARAEALVQADQALARRLETDEELTRLKTERAKVAAEAQGESPTLWAERLDRFRYASDAEKFAELHRVQEKGHRALLQAARLPGRLAEIRDLSEPGDIVSAYEDAVLSQHGDTIRAVAAAALRQLHREERAIAGQNSSSPRLAGLRRARQELQRLHAPWAQEHPSLVDRHRQCEAAIEGRERRLRKAHKHALRFAELRA